MRSERSWLQYSTKIAAAIVRAASAMLFPPDCAACGARIVRGTVCDACRASIRVHRHFFCAVCGARLSAEALAKARSPASGTTKTACHPAAPFLLAAAGSYEDPALKALIHALKFRGLRNAAEPLAEIVADYLAETGFDPAGFVLVPLPLHRRRRNRRGFNQTEEIGRHLARRLGIELRTDILVRIRHTKPQTEIPGAARQRNVVSCFAVPRPAAAAGKDIIILDDVTTSGATLAEAVRAMKAAGARKIVCLAAAKA